MQCMSIYTFIQQLKLSHTFPSCLGSANRYTMDLGFTYMKGEKGCMNKGKWLGKYTSPVDPVGKETCFLTKTRHRNAGRFNFHGLGCHHLAVASCGMRPGSLGVNFHRTFCRGNPRVSPGDRPKQTWENILGNVGISWDIIHGDTRYQFNTRNKISDFQCYIVISDKMWCGRMIWSKDVFSPGSRLRSSPLESNKAGSTHIPILRIKEFGP